MFSKSSTTSNSSSPNSRSLVHQAKAAKRRRFWRKAFKGFLWTLALAFVGHFSLNIYASIQLNRELSSIRQKGEPLQFSEMEPVAIQPSDNAALIYQQASASLHLSPKEKSALQVRERNITPAEEKVIESALRNNQKALTLTRQASAMPHCRFPVNWKGNPIRLRFPYYADIRELARLLAAEAKVKSLKGDRVVALRDVRALFGISQHLSNEPLLIGFLVAQSVDAVAHRALGETLQNLPFTVAQARALESSFPKNDWKRAYRHCLLGERTFGLFAFESLGQSAPEDIDEDASGIPAWTKSPLLWLGRPILKLDEVQTLRMWKILLDTPAFQQIPQPASFRMAQDAAIQNMPFYTPLTKILFPILVRSNVTRDRPEVRRRQREVALALACFHTVRGRYPTQLQEVVPLWGKPLPLDPYSQKAFVYRLSGKSFMLYSVGVNRVNDGGNNSQSKGTPINPYADDVSWLNP